MRFVKLYSKVLRNPLKFIGYQNPTRRNCCYLSVILRRMAWKIWELGKSFLFSILFDKSKNIRGKLACFGVNCSSPFFFLQFFILILLMQLVLESLIQPRFATWFMEQRVVILVQVMHKNLIYQLKTSIRLIPISIVMPSMLVSGFASMVLPDGRL